MVLLEHNGEAGRKILISGGGRCNFTNTGARADNFLSANPHFAKSALARYTPLDFIALVEKHTKRSWGNCFAIRVRLKLWACSWANSKAN